MHWNIGILLVYGSQVVPIILKIVGYVEELIDLDLCLVRLEDEE